MAALEDYISSNSRPDNVVKVFEQTLSELEKAGSISNIPNLSRLYRSDLFAALSEGAVDSRIYELCISNLHLEDNHPILIAVLAWREKNEQRINNVVAPGYMDSKTSGINRLSHSSSHQSSVSMD